jgi:hypothetical protein
MVARRWSVLCVGCVLPVVAIVQRSHTLSKQLDIPVTSQTLTRRFDSYAGGCFDPMRYAAWYRVE